MRDFSEDALWFPLSSYMRGAVIEPKSNWRVARNGSGAVLPAPVADSRLASTKRELELPSAAPGEVPARLRRCLRNRRTRMRRSATTPAAMPPAIAPTFDFLVSDAEFGELGFESGSVFVSPEGPGLREVVPKEAWRGEGDEDGRDREVRPPNITVAVFVLDARVPANDCVPTVGLLLVGGAALVGAADVNADAGLRETVAGIPPGPTLGDGVVISPPVSDTAMFDTVSGTSPLPPKNDTSNKCCPSGSLLVWKSGKFDCELCGCDVMELGTVLNAKVSPWSML